MQRMDCNKGIIANKESVCIPKLIYKYKPIVQIDDLLRIIDIFRCNHIYLPTYRQLNDPLEGSGFNIEIPGYTGMSIAIAGEEERSPIEERKMKYRILSLSKKCDSPQLWAHYANNYQGICLCFSTDKTFSSIREVAYPDDRDNVIVKDEEIEKTVFDGFFFKQSGWSYEEEWRVVKREDECSDNYYLNFDQDEVKGVILGDKMEKNLRDFLISEIPEDVKIIRARPGYTTYRIILLPGDYREEYSGEQLPTIENMEEYLL